MIKSPPSTLSLITAGQRTIQAHILLRNLQRRVPDTEARLKTLHRALQESVIEAGTWADELRRDRGLGGAHGPDVQVANRRDAGEPGEIGPHRAGIDPMRDGIQRQVE